MLSNGSLRAIWAPAVLILAFCAGCGTTRWSDTARTATEQLLISNAVDRAVSEFDFTMLSGKEVFFDASFLSGVTDQNYIVSTLRQHLLDNGCILRDAKDQAEYVVEARSGGVGTDRSDVLFGVPAVSVPVVPGVPLPSAIPELPFAKSTNQKAVAKIAVFAYNRITGRPVMQTGVAPAISTAKNSWFFGAGPFQHGTVYEGTKLAAAQSVVPIIGGRQSEQSGAYSAPLNGPAVFPENLQTPSSTVVPAPATSPANAASGTSATTPANGKSPAKPPAATTPLPPVPPPAPGTSSSPQGGVSSGLQDTLSSASGSSTTPPSNLDLSSFGALITADKRTAVKK